MEDDIDIYADLPAIDLNLDKNDQLCNCEELKKELSSLQNKLEDIQKIKDNLEKNLSSLLKTARSEIARKDKMISDLRKRLDDTTFRRNNKGESRDFSAHKSSHQQHTMVEKYESAPLVHSQENETVLHETEFHRNEDKSKKPQYEDPLPTVFAARLHKRLMKDEKEDMKQRTSLKLDIEANLKDIPEENIIESDKENGSQSNMNNNGGESNTIPQHSDSENPYKKNLGKRMNEEDGTRGNKRLKIDDSKGKTDETDYDCTMQYEMKANLAQYEMKDNLAKFEDRLDVAHHLKEEEVPLDKRRAASEYQDTSKYNRDCTNGWRREERSNSRIASTSNHLEEPNNGYKKDDYRYNSRRRSYSRSRSDYESSSGHHLRERSNRTYRNRKYDDYKYDSQYRTKRDYRLKRDYENVVEGESKTRHRSRERGDLAWDKSRHTSSDIEDKEGTSSYKSKRYESRRIKETNVLHNKGLHERDKAAAEIDFRASSSRTIVNTTVNHGAKKCQKTTDQDKVKNESNIKPINSTENSNYLEEGEIVDSPEKKMDSAKISKDYKLIENDTKIEDKNEDTIASTTNDKSIPLQNNVITGKQSDKSVISTKEVEAASCSVQTTLKDPEETAESNSPGKNNAIVDEMRKCNNVEETCKSQSNEDLIDSTVCIVGTIEQVCEVQCNESLTTDSTTDTIGPIKQVCDSNVVKSRVDEESKTSIIEMADSNTEVGRTDDPDVESAVNKDKVSESTTSESPVTTIEANNSDNSARKIDDEESRGSKVTAKVEAVLIRDIENENQVPVESKSNVEINHSCLSDHNYVQDAPPPANAVQESAASPGRCETLEEAATLKETKAEEKVEVSSTTGMKRTTSSNTVKTKKNQPSKGMVIARRRRAVTLSDSNASMTVLMNTNKTSSSVVSSNSNSNEPFLKPRACKASRAFVKASCK